MRWIRGHPVRSLLWALILVLLGPETSTAAASPVRRGATYDGSGSQPQFPLALSPTDRSGSFILRFRVSRNARRITQLHVWGLPAACTRPPGGYFQPEPNVGSARIRSDGTFTAVLRALYGTAPVTLTGHFVSHGRARGTLDYRFRNDFGGVCSADGVWTAHVKPPPPRVQHFTGTTDQGTRVRFERTIERHPRVTRFSFASLRATFTSTGDQCGPVTVATGPDGLPPFDEFALTVHRRRFAGTYFTGGGFSIDIRGRFDVHDQASGIVSYADRGDCVTGNVHWTARRTR